MAARSRRKCAKFCAAASTVRRRRRSQRLASIWFARFASSSKNMAASNFLSRRAPLCAIYRFRNFTKNKHRFGGQKISRASPAADGNDHSRYQRVVGVHASGSGGGGNKLAWATGW